MTETFRALLAAIFPASPTLWLRLLLQWLVSRLAHILETHFDAIDHRPESRAWFAAGVAFAEDGVRLLIAQRTRELMGLPFRIQRNWRLPRPTSPPTFEQLIARWISLLESLEHIERIAKRRAERLLAEREASPLLLAASLQSTSHVPSGRRRKSERRACAGAFPPPCEARGRWIATSSSRDGGGSHARAPPIPRSFPNQTQPPEKLPLLRSHPHIPSLTPGPHPPT